MRIAILYICTGKYSIFWNSFYSSSEKHFLKDKEKHYFVFTDDEKIQNSDNIDVIYKKSKGFPYDSLFRFEMFLEIKSKLLFFDYVFFLNSNMLFVDSVGEEILPINYSSGLVATIHPGSYNKSFYFYNYERNIMSTAYIPFKKNEKYYYYMGGFNGGKVLDFLELSEICGRNINQDFKKGIIAVYHDESHLNKYLHGKEILRLSPEYGYPEDSNLPLNPKIIILNKIKHGGKYFDKLPQSDYISRFKRKSDRLISTFKWIFK